MIPLPSGPYDVIYADPPWSYECKKPTIAGHPGVLLRGENSLSPEHYYKTMSADEIAWMPVKAICSKNSVCFMWATNPLLPDAFRVLAAWGFEYKTTITWYKLRCKGMGYWFRGYTEFLLLGVRGNFKAFHSRQENIVAAPVGKHSEKPILFRKLIENETPNLKRLEMFARRSPDELWDVWGNEAQEPEVSLF